MKRTHIGKNISLGLMASAFLFIFYNSMVVTAALADNRSEVIKQNEIKMQKLREQKSYLEDLLYDPDNWLITIRGIPFAVKGDKVIKAITVFYYREVLDGVKTYNRNELSERIRSIRDASSSYKQNARREISSLNSKIRGLEIETASLKSGTHVSRQPVDTGRGKGTLKIPHWNWLLDQGEDIHYHIVCRYISRYHGGEIARDNLNANNAKELLDIMKSKNNFVSKDFKTELTIEVFRKSDSKNIIDIKKGVAS